MVMPDTDLAKAYGRRALAPCIAAAPLYAGERIGTLEVTASVGVAALEFAEDTPELTLKRADQARYCAKRDGRNRVLADAAQRQGRGFARITLDGIRMLNVPVKGSTNLRRHLSA